MNIKIDFYFGFGRFFAKLSELSFFVARTLVQFREI